MASTRTTGIPGVMSAATIHTQAKGYRDQLADAGRSQRWGRAAACYPLSGGHGISPYAQREEEHIECVGEIRPRSVLVGGAAHSAVEN